MILWELNVLIDVLVLPRLAKDCLLRLILKSLDTLQMGIADALVVTEMLLELHQFLVGKPMSKGGLHCDNRSAVISGRKGPDGVAEIGKRTRHVALRFSAVLPECRRLWFVPTEWQKADGLTKSTNAKALRNLLHVDSSYPKQHELKNEEEADMYNEEEYMYCEYITM